MERYVAFLRGVSPMNCKMPELKRCFEAAGFGDVKTLLSSGNVAFSAKPEEVPALESAAEAAMQKHLGKAFQTIVRPSFFLRLILEQAPFNEFDLPAGLEAGHHVPAQALRREDQSAHRARPSCDSQAGSYRGVLELCAKRKGAGVHGFA